MFSCTVYAAPTKIELEPVATETVSIPQQNGVKCCMCTIMHDGAEVQGYDSVIEVW